MIGNQRPLVPPEEVPSRLCPECGAALLTGDKVYQDNETDEVIGCEACRYWKATYHLNYNPSTCPYCNRSTNYDMRMLMEGDADDVAVACEECVTERLAGDVLPEYEPDPEQTPSDIWRDIF